MALSDKLYLYCNNIRRGALRAPKGKTCETHLFMPIIFPDVVFDSKSLLTRLIYLFILKKGVRFGDF